MVCSMLLDVHPAWQDGDGARNTWSWYRSLFCATYVSMSSDNISVLWHVINKKVKLWLAACHRLLNKSFQSRWSFQETTERKKPNTLMYENDSGLLKKFLTFTRNSLLLPPRTILQPWRKTSSSLNASLLTSLLSSSPPSWLLRSTTHRWRRNAETGCSSRAPRAAHGAALKAASLRSVTHRLADIPCVSCTCWWTELWSWITPLAATERLHHRCSGGHTHTHMHEFVENTRHKVEGQQLCYAGRRVLSNLRAVHLIL